MFIFGGKISPELSLDHDADAVAEGVGLLHRMRGQDGASVLLQNQEATSWKSSVDIQGWAKVGPLGCVNSPPGGGIHAT